MTDSTDTNLAEQIDQHIEENLEKWLGRLAELVAQPSISSQGIGLEETADLVASMLRDSGFKARVMPSAGFPVVYAETEGRSDRTLICYNHYDVQPPEPLELWNSPPFELTRRDGALFGRGIADDKGHIISRLAALDAVRSVTGGFPCRIKFMIEGEEEIASPNVPAFVEEHRDLLGADACVWETGGVNFEGRPMMGLGMRGICYVQYDVRTMNRDGHSGGAHVLPNAAWRLLRALATIKNEEEHVLVEGFYDDVRGPSDTDLYYLERMTSDDEQTRRSYGIHQYVLGLDGFEARKAVFSPTANIAGFSSGYEGEGSKTVIPSAAMAKMDFRLVPDQDPMDIYEKVCQHLEKQGFGDVQVSYLGGEAPAQTPGDDPFVQLGIRTAEEVYGKPANVVPLIGGSGPMHPFREYLDVPIITAGIGHPETFVHAPNEHILVENFVLGTRHMARILLDFPRISRAS